MTKSLTTNVAATPKTKVPVLLTSYFFPVLPVSILTQNSGTVNMKISRKLKFRLVLGWIALMSVLLYKSTVAEAWEIFQLTEITVVYRSFDGGVDPLLTQNPLQPDRSLDKSLDLVVNTDVFEMFYWNNTVHSMTDKSTTNGSGQFRMVGLEWALGIDFQRIWEGIPISFGRYHYSRHLLDTEWGLGHFPYEDSWELKLRLFQRR